MKLRCQPGDLAIVLRGENAGAFVTVLHGLGQLKPGDTVAVKHAGRSFILRIESDSGYYWWCEGQHELVDVLGVKCKWGAIPDHRLWPFRPPKPAIPQENYLKLEKELDEST